MRIFYIGNAGNGTTSCHRCDALRRLGHIVDVQDPYFLESRLFGKKWGKVLNWRTGYILLQHSIVAWLKKSETDLLASDLIWINGGELIGPGGMKYLKGFGRPIVLYNNDDPTGGRDGMRFHTLLKAIPYYDLCAVVRECNVAEFKSAGAKNVRRVWMSYDEIAHAPVDVSPIEPVYLSDIAFIGTWMRHEKRDEFLLHLVRGGIDVAIWGERWEKSPHWEELGPYLRGGPIKGKDYTKAIGGAKICLGLLSKGNRDLHTQRSFEIPYAGGLLCAQRTTEHEAIFKEDCEAVFWADEAECLVKCKTLLATTEKREAIRVAGAKKVREAGLGNEKICADILTATLELSAKAQER